MTEKYIAMCGLNCSSCDAFIATKNNDDKLRKGTAEKWSRIKNFPTKAEVINCFGCLSQDKPVFRNCLICEVRKCGIEKGVKNCKECKKYKCVKLIKTQEHFFK